jgi:hypothetical protein
MVAVTETDLPVDAGTTLPLPGGPGRTGAAATLHVDAGRQRGNGHAVRTMMLVGQEPDERVLARAAEADDCDVIVVAPMSTAYSRIKQLAPTVVVVAMAVDDVEACQLMSMLKLDPDTSHIPVLTCLLDPVPAPSDI